MQQQDACIDQLGHKCISVDLSRAETKRQEAASKAAYATRVKWGQAMPASFRKAKWLQSSRLNARR